MRTQREVAEWLSARGIETKPQTVRAWKMAEMPGGRGRFDMAEIILWLFERERKRAGEGAGEWSQRRVKAGALREEVRLARETGQSISRERHDAALLEFGRVVLAEMDAAAARVRGAKRRREFGEQCRAIRQAVVDRLGARTAKAPRAPRE